MTRLNPHYYQNYFARKLAFEFPTRTDTNRAVQLQKIASGLKFGIYNVEGSYYLCSENKGANKLSSYHTADLGLLFWHMQKAVFLITRRTNKSIKET